MTNFKVKYFEIFLFLTFVSKPSNDKFEYRITFLKFKFIQLVINFKSNKATTKMMIII